MCSPMLLSQFMTTVVSILCGAVLCSAQTPAEKELRVLQTSLDRSERIEALVALREARAFLLLPISLPAYQG